MTTPPAHTPRRLRPLPPFSTFLLHFVQSTTFASLFVLLSLLLGAVGYHLTAHLPWLDSFLNASMILTGMGPVDRLDSSAAKLFATFYALFSGFIYLVTASLVITPIARRIIHQLHLDIYEKE